MNLDEAELFRQQMRAAGAQSDGCTLAPELGTPCCEMHDFLRRFKPRNPETGDVVNAADADRLFRECLQNKGHPILAWVYWAAVRLMYILGLRK